MALSYTLGTPTTIGASLKARKKRHKRSMLANLMLTPMVDMFSLMVIFLLQFFSASPDFNLTEGVVLPESASTIELKDAPVVSLSKDAVYVNSTKVGALADVLQKPEPLVTALDGVKAQWLATHPANTFAGEINLEAHQEIPSTRISQMMAILSAQQYGSIQLVALGD